MSLPLSLRKAPTFSDVHSLPIQTLGRAAGHPRHCPPQSSAGWLDILQLLAERHTDSPPPKTQGRERCNIKLLQAGPNMSMNEVSRKRLMFLAVLMHHLVAGAWHLFFVFCFLSLSLSLSLPGHLSFLTLYMSDIVLVASGCRPGRLSV